MNQVKLLKNVICLNCGTKETYRTEKRKRHYIGDGYDFEMEVMLPICSNCGEIIPDNGIEEEIAKIANEKIRESRGIIKKEEIDDILTRYHVSQKMLSKILGWGEITLTRYINGGYTPSIQNSNKLKSLRNPYILQHFVEQKIEESNEEIKKEVAFRKLQDNLCDEIKKLNYTKGKIFGIINWFLSKSSVENQISHLTLQKILYFSQAWHYGLNGQWLFEDDCEAWGQGAVYRSVYDEFKEFKNNPLPHLEFEVQLTDNEKFTLELIKSNLLDVYTTKALENMCHLEEPYIQARKNCNEQAECFSIIDKDYIALYYEKIMKKYNITKQDTSNISIYINDLLRSNI